MIQVRNVPEDLHRRLKERGAREGVTLSELARSMERPTRRELLDRLAAMPAQDYHGETAAESVRGERDTW